MSRLHTSLLAFALAVALVAFAPLAHAASAKKYQVTGVVKELTDDMVVVEKPDGEKWELNRDPKAVIKGQLKVGAKVTLMYTMTIASGEVKPAGK